MGDPDFVRVRYVGAPAAAFEVTQSTGVRIELVRGGEVRTWYPEEEWSALAGPLPSNDDGVPKPDELLLVGLGPDLLDRAHKAIVPLLLEADASQNQPLSDCVQDFRQRLHRSLVDFGVRLDTNGPADLIVTPPGHPSTSYNYGEGHYVGLHVDRHDDLPIGRRAEARRLCVMNIGWSPRYLNFFPHRLRDLCRGIGVDPDNDPDLTSRQLTDQYFRCHMTARIWRACLAPGQAYVLNTQDVVHDGAIPAGATPGIAFHSMGSWLTAGVPEAVGARQ